MNEFKKQGDVRWPLNQQSFDVIYQDNKYLENWNNMYDLQPNTFTFYHDFFLFKNV